MNLIIERAFIVALLLSISVFVFCAIFLPFEKIAYKWTSARTMVYVNTVALFSFVTPLYFVISLRDGSENMIQLKIENSVETPSTGITVDQFINPDLNQQIIEENVSYITGSHNYSDLETYMQKNVDKEFKARDFIIVENDMNGLLAGSGVIYLDMRLNVNGVISNNFGYLVTCINGKAALITFIGEKNPEFDITKAGTQQLSDEEAKQKAIEADGYKYKVDEQRITRFFDMKELKQKCEVETVYIDDGGHYFATSNIF